MRSLNICFVALRCRRFLEIHPQSTIHRRFIQDVAWFKPAQLVTKFGLEGNIQGSVGDHGMMKVHFGRPIQGHDTVCLHLFKRVYPKFVRTPGDDSEDGNGALSLFAI